MVARASIPACLRRLALLGSLLIGLALPAADIALAHANLVRSAPAANAVLEVAPRVVQLWFSEPPEPRFTDVRLLDRDARPVSGIGGVRADPADANLLLTPLPALSDGVCTVVWRTVSSVDGHATGGSFAFAVGRDQVLTAALPAATGTTAGSPGVLAVVVRWLGYLALALLVGGLAFFPAVGRSAGSAPRTVLTAGWWLSLVTTFVAAVHQAAASANVGLAAAIGAPLVTLLAGTRYGAIFWLRVGLLVALGGLLLAGRSRSPSSGWWWTGLALGVVVLLTTSLNSHAAAGPLPVVQVIADWLHLTAMSIWVGGLVTLALLLRSRPTDIVGHGRAVADVVGRFSRVALACVVVLGVTGVYRGVVETADPANLTDTAYGTALLVKVGLFLPALGLAAVNLLFVKGRVAEASSALDAGLPAARAHRLICRTVGGEILFVAAILLATGLLVNLPPARDVYGSGLVVRGQADDLRTVLAINPGQAGLNRFDVYLRGSGDGRPLADAQKVALIFAMVEHDMGQTEAVADKVDDGHYVVQGGYVSMVGTWQAELLVRRTGLDDARTVLTFRPAAADVNPVPADAESIARGEAIYQANCVACHGSAGRGDGPLAGSFNRPPDARAPASRRRTGVLDRRRLPGVGDAGVPVAARRTRSVGRRQLPP